MAAAAADQAATLGACRTPIPLSYTRHTSRFMVRAFCIIKNLLNKVLMLCWLTSGPHSERRILLIHVCECSNAAQFCGCSSAAQSGEASAF